MPKLHMTDLKLKSLAKTPPEKPKQIDYFDDVTKGGVLGLMLKHAFGGTLTWYCMHYEGGKSKLFKLGKYPAMKLAVARTEALALQEALRKDPKHLANLKRAEAEAESKIVTFAMVVEKYRKLYIEKEKLRTAKVINRRIDKHQTPKFRDMAFDAMDLINKVDPFPAR